MPIARSFSLTCGLWMISPVRKTRRSGKRCARLVRVVDGAIDAVAEAEFAGEVDREAPGAVREVVGLDLRRRVRCDSSRPACRRRRASGRDLCGR